MLERRVHALLTSIADATYPGKIRPFFLEICARELRSKHADYQPAERRVRIFNLSKPTPFLVHSGIHELAHHCEFCLFGATGHSPRFYDTMFALLKTAIEMGIIQAADALDPDHNAADIAQLRRRFGDKLTAVQSRDTGEGALLVKVTNAFAIKDILKERGYRFSGIEAAWCKEIAPSEKDAEWAFLTSIHSEEPITVAPAHRAEIEAIYHIVVKGGYEQREQLKAAGYLFNGYGHTGKVWVKRILAQTLDDEERRLGAIGITAGSYKIEGRAKPPKVRRKMSAATRQRDVR